MYKKLILAGVFASISTLAYAYGSGNPNPSMGDNSNLGSTTLGANTSGGRDGNLHFDGTQDKEREAMNMEAPRRHHHHYRTHMNRSAYDER